MFFFSDVERMQKIEGLKNRKKLKDFLFQLIHQHNSNNQTIRKKLKDLLNQASSRH